MRRPLELIEQQAPDRLAPGAAGILLRHALEERRPPEERQVFVNRTLRMEKVRYVGFDLDWTLADYDLEALSQLTFRLALERLITGHGYPRSILAAEYRPHFSRRGLMLDTEEGMVLKMNRHRYVGRAYHGRHFLDAGERARLYRREPIRTGSDRFYFADTFFELPEINLFSELVEMTRRRRNGPLPEPRRLFRDVRAAVDAIHADGTLKQRIAADLPRYLPRDPELLLALQRLALGGRRLLLITNSEWSYTDAVMRYLFDGALPDVAWRDLFDLVIVEARKPGFFRRNLPCLALDGEGRPGAEEAVPAWGRVYQGGSLEGLMRLLDCLGEQVLYVGDHVYGDVLSSKRASTWRTALILRELEEELTVLSRHGGQLRSLDVLRSELADLGQRLDDMNDVLTLYRHLEGNGGAGDVSADTIHRTERQLKELLEEHRVLRHHTKRLQSRISRAVNPYWGSVFKQGANKSLFGSQVDDYACIYTSRVSNLAYYGSDHYYRVLRDPMMHETAG